jgi:transposase
METRPSPISCTVVNQELLQLGETSEKSMRSDKTKGLEHHAVQEMMEILGSPFAYRRTQNGLELFSHPPYSPDLASDYHLFRTLKDHLRGHHYKTDEAVQEAIQSWL